MEKYIDFVDAVTSQESKSWNAFMEKLTLLYRQGFTPQRMMTASIGLASEAGEFSEIVKKIVFQGKPFDEEVKELINMAYRRAEELMVTHKPKLVRVAEYLIVNEVVSGLNIDKLFNGEDLDDEAGSPAVPQEPSPANPAYTPTPPTPAMPQPASIEEKHLGQCCRPGGC